MPMQMRIYTINRGALHQFAEEWREHVYPLRLAHGYQIHGAWAMEETNQFVWLISHDGPESWEESERAYYSSAARRGIDPNPARLIARPEEYFVDVIV